MLQMIAADEYPVDNAKLPSSWCHIQQDVPKLWYIFSILQQHPAQLQVIQRSALHHYQ